MINRVYTQKKKKKDPAKNNNISCENGNNEM